jgi:hypothetical protein
MLPCCVDFTEKFLSKNLFRSFLPVLPRLGGGTAFLELFAGKSVLRQRTSTLEAVARKDLNSYLYQSITKVRQVLAELQEENQNESCFSFIYLLCSVRLNFAIKVNTIFENSC